MGGESNVQSCVSPDELKAYLAQHEFYAHAECSAATGAQVKESCIHLVTKIHTNNQTEMATPMDKQLGHHTQKKNTHTHARRHGE